MFEEKKLFLTEATVWDEIYVGSINYRAFRRFFIDRSAIIKSRENKLPPTKIQQIFLLFYNAELP